MEKKQNAYFTVEAAMVFPVVLFVNILLIYLAFFQYDRCIMEQNAGLLALKACTVQENDKEKVMQTLRRYEVDMDGNYYVMWNPGDIEMKLERGRIRVAQSGNLLSLWDAETCYENHRVNPVSVIRKYRKLTGGM